MKHKLLEALFSRHSGIRGRILTWKKGEGSSNYDINETSEIYTKHLSTSDWYFHVATHDPERIKSRGSINSAQHFTCLWADIDLATKDSTKYLTQEQVSKLFSILKDQDCEPSMVVDSGRGYHAYWYLDQPYECSDYVRSCKVWQGWLNQLISDNFGEGKSIDQTGDMARILRLPGSLHKVSGKLVREMESDGDIIERPLSHYLSFTNYNPDAGHNKHKTAFKNQMLENMGMVFPEQKGFMRHLGVSCRQVAEFCISGGDVPEPLWYTMAGVLPFTDIGEEMFISFDRVGGEGSKKIEQWNNNCTGPATCNQINDVNPGICQGCNHFGKITTPLQLSRSAPINPTKEIINGHAAELNNLSIGEISIDVEPKDQECDFVPPFPFYLDEDRGICIQQESGNDKGKIKIVCSNFVIPEKRLWDRESMQEVIYFKVKTRNDGWRTACVPLSKLQGSCPAMADIMGAGALIINSQSATMASYLVGCVKYLQDLKMVEQSYNKVGWCSEDGSSTFDRFVLNELTFYNDGKVKRESLSPELDGKLKDIHMKGDFQKWLQATATLSRDGMKNHLFCFIAGFAVPLFAATDYHGMMVSLLSKDSGTFKSWTLKMITSIYGEPTFRHILARDSAKSITKKVAMRTDLPIVFDEVTGLESADLSDLVYTMTQGREHDRLNQDSTLKTNNSNWRSVMFCTTNSSLDDTLGYDRQAERMRLMELSVQNCAEDSPMDVQTASKAMGTIEENYGQAGVAWINYLANNRDQIFAECDNEIVNLSHMHPGNEKRFIISLVALTIVAFKHTKKLALQNFDEASFVNHAHSLIQQRSDDMKEDNMTPGRYLTEYISENLSTILVIKTKTNGDTEVVRSPRNGINGKLEYKGGSLDINTQFTGFFKNTDVKRYLYQKRVAFKDLISELQSTGVLIRAGFDKHIAVPGDDGTLKNGASFNIRGFEIDMKKFNAEYGSSDSYEDFLIRKPNDHTQPTTNLK